MRQSEAAPAWPALYTHAGDRTVSPGFTSIVAPTATRRTGSSRCVAMSGFPSGTKSTRVAASGMPCKDRQACQQAVTSSGACMLYWWRVPGESSATARALRRVCTAADSITQKLCSPRTGRASRQWPAR